MTPQDVQSNFRSELDAIVYFEHLRWGNKVKCAYCGTEKVSQRQSDLRFHCSQCRRTFSVTTGTWMHNSKLPLKIWMQAFSLLGTANAKVPVKRVQNETGTSYSTAWYVHRDIKAMLDEELSKGTPKDIFETLCKRAISPGKS
jgi:transposase-like protein